MEYKAYKYYIEKKMNKKTLLKFSKELNDIKEKKLDGVFQKSLN